MPDTMIQTETATLPNRSADIKELAAALVKAQASMESAKKDSTNPHFGNKYADLAAVWEAVRKPLTDNGLSVVQLPTTAGQGVEIETMLLHTSGQYVSNTLWVPCSKNDAQGLGSAITYGRRYALMAVVGVAPEEDDGNAAVKTTPKHIDQPHKPGPTGSASSGGDFRPPGPRRFNSSANGREMIKDDPHLIDKSKEFKPTLDEKAAERAAKIAAKAKKWVDDAIGTVNLSGQSVDSLSQFLSASQEQIDFLEANAPAEHERFFAAYNEAADAARAKVAA